MMIVGVAVNWRPTTYASCACRTNRRGATRATLPSRSDLAAAEEARRRTGGEKEKNSAHRVVILLRMEGIRFLTDEKGRRVAIVDVDQYRERWEDFHDQIIADFRLHQPNHILIGHRRRRLGRRRRRGSWLPLPRPLC